jgi:hypothetical protein
MGPGNPIAIRHSYTALVLRKGGFVANLSPKAESRSNLR